MTARTAPLLDQFGAPITAPRGLPAGAGKVGAIVTPKTGAWDAADYSSPDMRDWNPGLLSPDVENNFSRDTIVARIRDLVRNDGWASGAITRITDGVIGGDLRPVARPDWRALSAWSPKLDKVWADEFGRAAESLWRNWANDIGRWSDAGRRYTMGQLFALAFRQILVDGEALAQLVWAPERMGPGRARYGTALMLIDADRLSNPRLTIDTINLRGGVELDGYGAATAYHVRRAHLGDWFNAAATAVWDRVPRETAWGRPVMLHHFISDRPAQHRGAGGILKPVLGRLRMLSSYDTAELQAAIVNAIFSAYIESPYDPAVVQDALSDATDVGSYQGLRSEFHQQRGLKLGNARIPTLFPGEKIVAVDSARPNTNYAGFEGAVLRNVATAIGTSAEQITQDWSKTNYSSARAALLEAWKTLKRHQQDFGAGFASPIYAAFIEEAMDRGELPMPAGAPDFIEARTEYAGVRWMGPPRGWIDPVREAQAAVLRMDAGLSTLEQECAEQGQDWEDVIEQRAIERRRFKELDLPFPAWFGLDATDAAKPPQPE